MSSSTILIAALMLLCNLQFVYLQDLSAQANANAQFNNSPMPPQNGSFDQHAEKEIHNNFEDWKKCPMYLPSFELDVISIPDVQREFVNNMVATDLKLFREILTEAINKRNSFAPSVSLMWKYTGKLLGKFIRNRQDEQKISPRKEPIPAFFELIATLAERVINRSDEVKKSRGYNKNNVDVNDLYQRVDNVFNYLQRLIAKAPVGAYLKWDQLVFFMDEPSPDRHLELLDEAGDLTARFRAMGYDKCIFVARRIINLLRMFSKGRIPTEKEV